MNANTLCITSMRSDRLSEKLPCHPRMSAMLAAGFGIAVSSIFALWLQSVENRRDEQVFQAEANERFNAVDRGLQNAIGLLADLNRAFAASCFTGHDQFRAFARPLLDRHSYIYSIAFHRYVDGSRNFSRRRPDGETRLASQAAMEYAVRDIAARAGGDTPPILDASVIRSQELALSRAGSSALPAATGLFRLPPLKESAPYFSVVATAYRNVPMPQAGSLATHDTAGYTLAVLNARNLAEGIFRQGGFLEENIDITLLEDGSDGNEEGIIFRHRGAAGPASRRGNEELLSPEDPVPGEMRISRVYDVAGSRWQMTVSAGRNPSSVTGAGPWMALVGGSLISLMLAAYFQLLANRARMLELANKAQEADIASLKSMELKLLDAQDEMHELAAYQDRVVESERKRIAREIHDDLGQNLLALHIDATLLDQQTAAAHPHFNARVKILLMEIDATVKSVRAIINYLRPTVLDQGLCVAVEWLVQQMASRSKIAFRLTIDDEQFCRAFDDEQATAIFRIMQEALSNVVRHANARHAEIRVGRKDDRLHLIISDDGIGTYPGNQRKPRSFGLIGIRERVLAMGGEFFIESAPDLGTTLSFFIPARSRRKGDD